MSLLVFFLFFLLSPDPYYFRFWILSTYTKLAVYYLLQSFWLSEFLAHFVAETITKPENISIIYVLPDNFKWFSSHANFLFHSPKECLLCFWQHTNFICSIRDAVTEHTVSFVKIFSTIHIWVCIFDIYSLNTPFPLKIIFRKHISVHFTLC